MSTTKKRHPTLEDLENGVKFCVVSVNVTAYEASIKVWAESAELKRHWAYKGVKLPIVGHCNNTPLGTYVEELRSPYYGSGIGVLRHFGYIVGLSEDLDEIVHLAEKTATKLIKEAKAAATQLVSNLDSMSVQVTRTVR